ncbi:hypothetical protein HBA54_09420 [Pelagibius litoralis]|uniref:Peptidoglycan binding-like domain-containing protein n=1 Tax=Pelagibius litoralis TaxID=374515 RepID=A0A967EVZ4_9PROT|nr:peptidoglycan-binding domain-containing protein [Pelagibius litoralis]NIA68809.1 hypothetical protein [Pelagibius litoralis]
MYGFPRALAPGLLACLTFLAPQALADNGLAQSDLLEFENLLRDLGFDPGPVDGIVDAATLAAIGRYQDFASLPGDPEPNKALLAELRGVAAAFAALRNDSATAETPTTAAEPALPGTTAPESTEPGTAAKTIVPPPPAPPKLRPLEAAPEPAAEPPQVAALPPAEEPAPVDAAPEDVTQEAATPPDDPAAERQARIEEALQPHRKALADGSITRPELARQFNLEGRQLLAGADYGGAIVKFDVAIFLDPGFAGAYSNRGTAHELSGDRAAALEDFADAKKRGFGGFRSN